MWRTVNPKAKPLSLVSFSKHIILKAIIFMQDPLHDSVLNMRCSQCETEIDKLRFYLHFCQAHLVCEEVWRFVRCIIIKGIVVHGVWVRCLTPTVIAEYLGGTDMCVDEPWDSLCPLQNKWHSGMKLERWQFRVGVAQDHLGEGRARCAI